MEVVKYRFVSFCYALLLAMVLTKCTQWALSYWWDITAKSLWFQGGFLILTILLWAPWKKPNLPPKNDGNNDLFPGQ